MAQLLQAVIDTQKNNYKSIGQVNAGDTLELELELRMNGKPIIFDSIEAELLIKKSDNNRIRQTKDILYQGGKFKIKVDRQGITYPGVVTCQLLTKEDGRVSTCLFYFIVGTSLDREILQSIDKVEVLEQLDEYVLQAFENLREFEERIEAGDATIRKLNDDMIAAETNRENAEADRGSTFDNLVTRMNNVINVAITTDETLNNNETARINNFNTLKTELEQIREGLLNLNNSISLDEQNRVQAELDRANASIEAINRLNTTNTNITNEEATRVQEWNNIKSENTTLKEALTTINNTANSNEEVRKKKEEERIAAEQQRQANFETMQQENNSFKERIDAQYETLINENNEFKQEVIDGQVIGERLLAHYVHNSNKEIHFIQFDFETGIGTTSEPHGIVTANEILIAPNDWTLENRNYNCRAVPIEWTRNNDRIKLVRIDDHTLKVTKNDGITIIPVDLSNISNKFVDVSNFHFEIPYAWNLTNFPFDTTHIRVLIKGYIKSAGQYRYTSWNTIDFNGREVGQSYLNLLGAPYPNNAGSTHCVFGIEDWTLDFRDGVVRFNVYSVFEGRRAGYENIVWDTATENTYRIYPRYGEDIKRLSRFGTYSDHYAYTSNGTHIYIYDLGGSK